MSSAIHLFWLGFKEKYSNTLLYPIYSCSGATVFAIDDFVGHDCTVEAEMHKSDLAYMAFEPLLSIVPEQTP